MRAHRELLTEIYRFEAPPPLPAEVTGSHPYIEAMIKDGLLADDAQIGGNWLDDFGLPFESLEREEITRRFANRRYCAGPTAGRSRTTPLSIVSPSWRH